MKTNKEKDPHPVTVILRDWTKAKKANTPVAEIHTRKETKKMTTKEKILRATHDYEEAKRLLAKTYKDRFEALPVSECGEVNANDILALNEWEQNESRRLLNEWTNKVVHA